MFGLGLDVWAYGVLAVVLIIAAITDVRSGKIKNWVTYPAVLAGLVGHALAGYFAGGETFHAMLFGAAGSSADQVPAVMGFADAVGGLAIGFGPLLLAWLAGGIGGGDAKIMGAVGALVGWRFALVSMFYGFGVAIVMAIGILLYRRRMKETLGRIGRFLVLVFVRARPSSPAAEDSPTLPFGLALCIGAAIALTLTCIVGPARELFLLGQ
jgi:prepilin peptidase CpaA